MTPKKLQLEATKTIKNFLNARSFESPERWAKLRKNWTI